jgi:putative methyltransferase (TIGR04325 family)
MSSRFRSFAKRLIPPVIADVWRRSQDPVSFRRGFHTWNDARRASLGYDSDAVIEAVAAAARKVRDGEAAYERDSVLFDRIHYAWPVLASLLYIAAQKRSLHVVDIGGSLGTGYRQNRKFLESLDVPCTWRVVEQGKFVTIGTREFSDPPLSFHDSVEEVLKKPPVDCAMACGVLGYLEDPYGLLERLVANHVDYVLLDRTQISGSDVDTFAVQEVRPPIYHASLPVRNCSLANLMRPFDSHYEVIEQWQSEVQADPQNVMIGCLLRRR